jgi:hypothetical protein
MSESKRRVALFLVLVAAMALVFPLCLANEEVLVDSYPEENADIWFSIKGLHPSVDADLSGFGQCFLTGDVPYNITTATFHMKKNESPTGMAHAVLYAMAGTFGVDGKPTGSPLATSDDFDVSALTVDFELVNFTFVGDEQFGMQIGTHYCIVYENPIEGFIDSSNYTAFSLDNSSPTHNGNWAYYNNDAWSVALTRDSIFYVYGVEFVPEVKDLTDTADVAEWLLFGLIFVPIGIIFFWAVCKRK